MIRKRFSLTGLAWVGVYLAFVVLVVVVVFTSDSDMAGLGLLLIAYPIAGSLPSFMRLEALGTAFCLNCLLFHVVGWAIEYYRSQS